MKKICLLFLILLSGQFSFSQPTIQWQSCYGGSKTDEGRAVEQTADGGYIVAGRCFSSDSDVVGHHWNPSTDNMDFWVLKFDSTGSVVWKKCYGSGSSEEAY